MATVDARPIIAARGEPFNTLMAAAAGLAGVYDPELYLDWNPSMMDDTAAFALGFRVR